AVATAFAAGRSAAAEREAGFAAGSGSRFAGGALAATRRDCAGAAAAGSAPASGAGFGGSARTTDSRAGCLALDGAGAAAGGGSGRRGRGDRGRQARRVREARGDEPALRRGACERVVQLRVRHQLVAAQGVPGGRFGEEGEETVDRGDLWRILAVCEVQRACQ